jgi:hypothetical protein
MGYLEVRVASLYDEKVLGAKDRIALARKLQEKGDNIAAGQMVSGWYVPNTGGAALGALQNIIGAYQESGAREDLDKAEMTKNKALANGLLQAGLPIPQEMRDSLATPEQTPSWGSRLWAGVTGGEQPQTVPRQEFTQQPAKDLTPDQRMSAISNLVTVAPEYAAPLQAHEQFMYSKQQDKENKQEALQTKKEIAAANAEERAAREKEHQSFLEQMQKDRFVQQDANARLVASFRQNQGSESSYTPVTFENGERGRFNRRTGEYEPVTNLPGDLTYKAPKGLSQAASNSLEYGTRMQDADAIIEKVGTNYTPWKLKASESATNIPIIGAAATGMLPVNEQLLKQAKESFIHAKLRKESGAKIDPNEFEAADRIYFPQPNDTPEVLAQKAASRKSAIEGVLSAVPKDQRPAIGGALGGESPVPVATTRPPVQQQMTMQPPVQQQMPMQPPVQQAPAKPQSLQPGEVYKGHVYLGGDLSNPASWRAQ